MSELALAAPSMADLDVSELRELYMKSETAPEVLRAHLDHLKDQVARLELLHAKDTAEIETLIGTKHDSVGFALNELRARATSLEGDMVAVYGDPKRDEDKGLAGRNASSLKKVWDALDKAKDERWKLKLMLVSLAGAAGLGGNYLGGLLGL